MTSKKKHILYDKPLCYNQSIEYCFNYHIAKELKELYKLKPEGIILDVGCGTGKFLLPSSEERKVIGIDLSVEMIKFAKRRNKGVEFVLGDATRLPFKNNGFDFIGCVNSMHHFYEKEKFINEIYRCLKEDGSFFLSDIILPYFFLIPFAGLIWIFFAVKAWRKFGVLPFTKAELIEELLFIPLKRKLLSIFKKKEMHIKHKTFMKKFVPVMMITGTARNKRD